MQSQCVAQDSEQEAAVRVLIETINNTDVKDNGDRIQAAALLKVRTYYQCLRTICNEPVCGQASAALCTL